MKEFKGTSRLPLQELNCGRKKSDSTVQGIGKTKKTTRFRFVGPSFCGVNMKILKKVNVLAGLLDKNEPARDQGDQQ